MYILDLASSFNRFIKDVKNFFLDNYTNPLMWLLIIAAVLSLFGMAYTILHGRD